jgi:hypothetical protein
VGTFQSAEIQSRSEWVGGERSVKESSESLRVRYFENGLNLEAVDENDDVLVKPQRLVLGPEAVVRGTSPGDGRRLNGRLELVGDN